MKNDFRYLLKVRYAECDAQKVVFNGKYVEYIDVAVTEYIRVIWGNFNSLLERGIDQQVVRVVVNWQAPAHFDEVLALSVKLQKLGNTSFTLGIEFTNHTTSKFLADGEITYVMVNTNNYEKMPIPQDLRSQLEAGAPGIVVNHAG